MQALLNFTTKILAFGDPQASSNPSLRFIDWTRNVSGVAVNNPKVESHRVDPGATVSVFSGIRTLTIDGTTAFSLALLGLDGANTYRMTHTAGAVPGFRLSRGIAASGVALTFTVNPNLTVTLSAASALFGSVVAGDHVFVPHTTTGDSANVISVLNAGYWVVLGVTDTQNLTLVRPSDQDFEAIGETITPVSNNQLRIYSSSGVQIGDSIDITAGFSTAARQTYTVSAATDSFVQFTSSTPLPPQTGIVPGAAGVSVFADAKRLVYIETTQEVVVRINGDTGDYQRTTPFDSSDTTKPGFYGRHGPTWSLVIYNRSPLPSDVTVLLVE